MVDVWLASHKSFLPKPQADSIKQYTTPQHSILEEEKEELQHIYNIIDWWGKGSIDNGRHSSELTRDESRTPSLFLSHWDVNPIVTLRLITNAEGWRVRTVGSGRRATPRGERWAQGQGVDKKGPGRSERRMRTPTLSTTESYAALFVWMISINRKNKQKGYIDWLRIFGWIRGNAQEKRQPAHVDRVYLSRSISRDARNIYI